MRFAFALGMVAVAATSHAFTLTSVYRETSVSANSGLRSLYDATTTTINPLPITAFGVNVDDLAWAQTTMAARPVSGGTELRNTYTAASKVSGGSASTYGYLEAQLHVDSRENFYYLAVSNASGGAIGTVSMYDETRSNTLFESRVNPNGWSETFDLLPGDYRIVMVSQASVTGIGAKTLIEEVTLHSQATPEPSTLLVCGIGLAAVARKRSRKN